MAESRAHVVLAAILIAWSGQAWTQSQPTDRPDLSGVWMAYGSSGGGAGQLSERGQEIVDAFYGSYREVPDPGMYCVPTGMPTVITSIAGYPIEIVQQERRVTMLAEREMQVRRVHMDGRAHPDNYPPTAVGHSIGHWDGDTLVVETQLLTGSLLRQWPRTEQTQIVERISVHPESEVQHGRAGFIMQDPIDDQVLVIEITISDPVLYASPQTRTLYYRRIPDDAILEYDCALESWRYALEEQRID